MVAKDLYNHKRDFGCYLGRELDKLFSEDREKVKEFLSGLGEIKATRAIAEAVKGKG